MKRMVCGAIAFFLLLTGCGSGSESGGPTLPGSDEIYPAVMVEGSLYEWRRGAAVLDKLPDSAEYVADIKHSGERTPAENDEFVSVFDAAGEIYAEPDDDALVYLLLSTDWMQEKAVIFDRVRADENARGADSTGG